MDNKFGFTMTELIITLVIVAILAIIAIPAYRGYVKRGIVSEGKALLGEVAAAQQIFYSRNGHYYAGTAGTQFSAKFGVDARRNKYFTHYEKISVNDTTGEYIFKTNEYKGHSLTVKGSFTAEPEIIDNVTDNIN